eukprot:5033749-Pyramimonas_sp.AAC.1
MQGVRSPWERIAGPAGAAATCPLKPKWRYADFATWTAGAGIELDLAACAPSLIHRTGENDTRQ